MEPNPLMTGRRASMLALISVRQAGGMTPGLLVVTCSATANATWSLSRSSGVASVKALANSAKLENCASGEAAGLSALSTSATFAASSATVGSSTTSAAGVWVLGSMGAPSEALAVIRADWNAGRRTRPRWAADHLPT